MRTFLYSFFLFFFCLNAHATIESVFNQVKNDPNALYALLKEMPKGGELHYHLSGGAYPEGMLAVAAKEHYCLNPKTYKMLNTSTNCPDIEASQITDHPALYNKIIRTWSMKDFVPGKQSGHDHFFATFYLFSDVVMFNHVPLIAEVVQRAADQNELYMEIMLMPDYAKSTRVVSPPDLSKGFDAAKDYLLNNKLFVQEIDNTVKTTESFIPDLKKFLHCAENSSQKACQVTVRFQYHILREQPLESFFMQALHAFAATAKSPALVGINVVQAEDGIISLRDYRKQMNILKFMHQLYPEVHIALHAGELRGSEVMPEDLRFHIHDALMVGQAERIGHGVDIGFEDHADKILAYMHDKHIPVEINLTSNEKILNISGKEHPLNYYLSHQVPVVLSTDDEGVLRTDLTRQYVKAVIEHGIDYKTLKQMTRNVLSFNFLPGKSLWQNGAEAKQVDECTQLNSPSCLAFVKNNEKAKLQRELELKLIDFEKQFP